MHWEHRPLVARIRPAPILERSRFVVDGDRLTSAGGTASLDMMHALIRARHGAALARETSGWFLHADVRPGDAAQRAALGERWGVAEPALLAVLAAMENHVDDPLSLAQLAAAAGVGPR